MFPAEPIIEKFGGVGNLARQLGYDYQRVHNWIKRGIPAVEVATRPEIFNFYRRNAVPPAPTFKES